MVGFCFFIYFVSILLFSVHCVRGDFDDDTSYPDMKVIPVGQFRIGLVHGHQFIPWGNIKVLDCFAFNFSHLTLDIGAGRTTNECGPSHLWTYP